MSKNIVVTFAGRRDRMSLLLLYVQDALARGVVDEWHVWNYARTPEDDEWVCSLESLPGVVLKTPQSKDSFKYAYESYPVDDCVYIKIDDDIVYLDVNGLDHMIEFRRLNRGYFAVSANTVNNPTCYLLQKEMGLFPDMDDMALDGPHATKIHRAFVGGAKVHFDSVAEVSSEYMLPINCIAWLGSDNEYIRHAASTTIDTDERNISHNFPKLSKRCVCVFGPCVASHLSYTSQGQEDGMPLPALLDLYSTFSNPDAMDPFPRV